MYKSILYCEHNMPPCPHVAKAEWEISHSALATASHHMGI